MKKSLVILFPCFVLLSLQAVSQDHGQSGADSTVNAQYELHDSSQVAAGRMSGTVIEAMEAGGYTYMQIETGGKKIWVAGPSTLVKPGSVVSVEEAMLMDKFHSKALNRDFDAIYFASRITENKTADIAAAHSGHSDAAQKPIGEPITGINKAEGGNTIAEILSQKTALAGKSVLVRGKVVKFTPEVMGKNWLHIQDGSGDITVTTGAKVKIGDVVLVEGKLALNKDFGVGYVYEELVENAKVVIERVL